MSFQYSLLPKRLMATIEQNAKKNVILILPVTLAPPGKIGNNPNRLVVKMKKNTVSK